MTQPLSMAQQIAQTAIAFEEERLGRKPTSVTVVLGGDTLVITMHGVLSRAEMTLAENPVGAAKELRIINLAKLLCDLSRTNCVIPIPVECCSL